MLTFLVFIYSFTTFFINTYGNQVQETNTDLRLIISPPGHFFGNGAPFIVRKVDDSLNLTCKLINENEDILPNYNITWNWQYSQGSNANRVMMVSLTHNAANLVFKSLKENDSGEYTCKCVELNLYENVRVKVKGFKRTCSNNMFACSNGNCIGRHYVCDGKKDCKFGLDEDFDHCGPNPCEGKIPCENGRCIPASWCCDQDRDPNCTTRVKPSCCQQLVKSYSDVDSSTYLEHPFGDMGFLQTTIYTVIGCALAFMIIVTILVIAICRVHLKRTIVSRCPLSHQHLRPNSSLRSAIPLYDIDMFLDRQTDHTGGLLVTYNINNGVQFVGRPVDPPPYCEIVDTPPREGPPPPYVSRENITEIITRQITDGSIENIEEIVENIPEVTTAAATTTTIALPTITNSPAIVNKPGENCNQTVDDTDQLSGEASAVLKKLSSPNLKVLTGKNDAIATIEGNNKNNTASSLNELSKFRNNSDCGLNLNSFEICSSVPSVSGVNNSHKLTNKNIKKNVFTDFSDSDTDSSYMENDSLLVTTVRKISDQNNDDIKTRSDSSTNTGFINNIATVSKNFIGSLGSKKSSNNNLESLDSSKSKPDKNTRKQFRPLLTQKSFDSSDRTRKDLVLNNFDKILPNGSHSLGDLSPVNSEINYSDFNNERREFLTLPLRESFIGVRSERQ